MRPFGLLGNVIQLYHYQLAYTDKDGTQQIAYEIDMPNIEATQQRLEREECCNFIVSEIDTTEVNWLEGLDVGECNMEKAIELWQMGEKAYNEMLNAPTTEQYLLDLDFELSKLKLGL